jgi:methylglutaconyl-CoA hydratase
MDFHAIRYAAGERVARITLNRPAERNALDDVMVSELTAAFIAAARDPGVKVVVLAGAGPAFCAGIDAAHQERMSAADLEQNRADSQRFATLLRTIYEIRKPVCALVHGPALGAGCGLATVCDFVLASRDRAKFAVSEVRTGMVPALIAPYLIRRVGEGRAREMILRGNAITATEAQDLALITAAVADDQLEKKGNALVAELVEKSSSVAMSMAKDLLSKLNGMNGSDTIDFTINVYAAARMTTECRKGAQAITNDQEPEW